MSNTKTPRLLAAAKEFNIGKETLIDFLSGKGFEVTNSPNFKLGEDMYDALLKEFAKDKKEKEKVDNLSLPKSNNELKEKSIDMTGVKKSAKKVEEDEKVLKVKDSNAREEEAIEPPKVVKKKAVTKDIPLVNEEVPPVSESKTKSKSEAKEEVEKIEVPEAVVKPAEEVKPEPPAKKKAEEKEKEKPKTSKSTESKSDENADRKFKIEAPKLKGPNVVAKVNLDDLNKKAKPDTKASKTKDEKATDKKIDKKSISKNVEKPQVDKEKAVVAEDQVVEKPKTEVPKEPEIIKHETQRIKLDGPKVLGKIELPVAKEKSKDDKNKKRKRKRIIVNDNKKPGEGNASNTGTSTGTGPRTNSGPYAGGGNRNNANSNSQGRYNNRPTDKKKEKEEDKVIDEKAVQDKIRETQARLAGTNKSKSLKAKYRKKKREDHAAREAADEEAMVNSGILRVTEFVTVSELASLMDTNFTEVISKCMNLGLMVSINQRLDAEVIELVASEFGYEVEFISLEAEEDEVEEIIDAEEDLSARQPIVTIMGHVDHGKTSLLDYLRKANVAGGEAGGITQHIGAYEVTLDDGREITFLDTPGHEAFTAMRARGAKVTDIAVIIVAADDAVMPQTKEAISHSQAAGVPMVFAINKIDKEGANTERIKDQLSQMNILVEDWGGKFQSQEISAKSGVGVNDLLEKILLEAELLDLKANPNRPATGIVLEASLDKGRGYISSVLIENGTLRVGDMIVAGSHYGKVKALTNERGQRIESAGPATPVQVLGLNGAPTAGEKVKVFEDEVEAKNVANYRSQLEREQGIRTKKHITLDEIGRRLALGNFKELNVIIKADFDGSVEALTDSLLKLSTEEIIVNVVHRGVGQITESDVLLATASDAIILGFQVRPSATAAKLAQNENIEIRYYSIIYDAIDEIKSAMEGMLEPTVEKKVIANVEIRETYKISGLGTIAGCYVLDGKINRQAYINLIRDGIVVYNGTLGSLKRFKDDAKEVQAKMECGLSIKNYNDIREGDIIEAYEEVEVKRKL